MNGKQNDSNELNAIPGWMIELGSISGDLPIDVTSDLSMDLHDKLSDFAAGFADQQLEDEIEHAISKNPMVLANLIEQFRVEAIINEPDEIPESVISNLRSKLSTGMPPVNEEFDFSILFYPDTETAQEHIEYEVAPEEVLETAGVLRENEPKISLLHRQRGEHFRLTVLIEIEYKDIFTITLEFEFISPKHDNEVSVILKNTETDETRAEIGLLDAKRMVRLSSIKPGKYVVELCSRNQKFDQFMFKVGVSS